MSVIRYDIHVQQRIQELKKTRLFKETLFVLLALVLFTCVLFAFLIDRDSRIDGLMNDLKSPVTTEKEPEWSEEDLLILVNADNPIPEDYQVRLKTLSDGTKIDEHMYEDLHEMFNAMRSLGIYPYINYAYRSPEEQERLMEEKVASYVEQGMSLDEAQSLASGWVSLPEYSEHRIGLALDITAESGEDEDVIELQQWLYDFAYLYGFILRYPADKEDITGYSYEPWHYRYVGRAAAAEMHESGLCLEEYVQQRNEE